MHRFKAILSYDGTKYFGWQKTGLGPSIQEALEKAIAQVAREVTTAEAASRTDRGVHAEGQVISFSLSKEWDSGRLQRALNAVLPSDIRIVELEQVPPTFHPTLQAREKEYHYRVCTRPSQTPIFRLYSWHYRYPLDLDAMQYAIHPLLGSHDFSAFSNERAKDPLCTLSSIVIIPLEGGRLQIALKGTRFLYKMARNLAAMLLFIGSKRFSADSLPSLLASRDRKRTAMTAPAHGLFLHRVFYDL